MRAAAACEQQQHASSSIMRAAAACEQQQHASSSSVRMPRCRCCLTERTFDPHGGKSRCGRSRANSFALRLVRPVVGWLHRWFLGKGWGFTLVEERIAPSKPPSPRVLTLHEASRGASQSPQHNSTVRRKGIAGTMLTRPLGLRAQPHRAVATCSPLLGLEVTACHAASRSAKGQQVRGYASCPPTCKP
jgi:hypothetical protein